MEVCDGTGWDFEYGDSDFSLKSNGSNEYPKKFRQFLRLLNKVVTKYGVTRMSWYGFFTKEKQRSRDNREELPKTPSNDRKRSVQHLRPGA
jgi:hypothetical protein